MCSFWLKLLIVSRLQSFRHLMPSTSWTWERGRSRLEWDTMCKQRLTFQHRVADLAWYLFAPFFLGRVMSGTFLTWPRIGLERPLSTILKRNRCCSSSRIRYVGVDRAEEPEVALEADTRHHQSANNWVRLYSRGSYVFIRKDYGIARINSGSRRKRLV